MRLPPLGRLIQRFLGRAALHPNLRDVLHLDGLRDCLTSQDIYSLAHTSHATRDAVLLPHAVGRALKLSAEIAPQSQGDMLVWLRDQAPPQAETHVRHRVDLPFGLPPAKLGNVWAPHGARFCCLDNNRLHVMRGEDGEAVGTSDHGATIVAFAWSPQGHVLASLSQDGTLVLTDAQRGHALGRLKLPSVQYADSLCWAPNGQALVATESGALVTVKPCAWIAVAARRQAYWAPCSHRFAQGRQVYDGQSGVPVAADAPPCCPRGVEIPLLNGLSQRVWDFVDAAASWQFFDKEKDVVRSPDGTHVAFRRYRAAEAESVVVLDSKTLQAKARLVMSQKAFSSDMEWSPDGAYLSVAEYDRPAYALYLVCVSSGKCIAKLPLDTCVTYVSWAPDSTRIAVRTFEGQVRVLDRGQLDTPYMLPHHDRGGGSAGLHWSSDGRLLASGCWVFDVQQRQLVKTLPGYALKWVNQGTGLLVTRGAGTRRCMFKDSVQLLDSRTYKSLGSALESNFWFKPRLSPGESKGLEQCEKIGTLWRP